MTGKYFKAAIRNLKRNKFFTLINILGFSVGLTTCIMIYLFVQHERGFEEHVPKADKLYRIVTKSTTSNGIEYKSSVPYPLGEALRDELPGHSNVASAYFESRQVTAHDDIFLEKGLLYTDSAFCNLFDVTFLQGDPSVLNEPGSVVLTLQLAKKYFQDTNPIGKKIHIREDFTVRGIVKTPPHKTHLPYRILISASSLDNGHIDFEFDEWGSTTSHLSTYIYLEDKEKIQSVEKLMNQIYNQHYESLGEKKDAFFLLPLKEIHTDDRFDSYAGTYTISKKLIWTFITIGLIVLFIALFNFINLSVVQAMRRIREVGLRKVMGATRKKLIVQFLGETFLVVSLSTIVSLILTELFLPVVNHQTENMISLSLYDDPGVLIFLLGIFLTVGFMAGLFPALFLSRYQPIEAIKNKLELGRKKTLTVHKVLVMLQFFIAQILVVSVLIMHHQIDFMKNKDLGFREDNMLIVSLPHAQRNKQDNFKNRLKEIPHISDVSFGMGEPLSGSNNVSNYQVIGDEKNYFANMKAVDHNYLDTYGIQLIAGRGFQPTNKGTGSDEVVVNQRMMKDVGFHRPDSAIGKYIRLFSKKRQIVGVVKDFHIYSLKQDLYPLILFNNTHLFAKAGIHISDGRYKEALPKIKSVFREFFPGTLFNYRIYEDYINMPYTGEEKFFDLLSFFTIIALIIASMGLIGLVSFLMNQRTKEIGIRKTLGASPIHIVLLYTSRFIKLILVSSIIAWPVIYYVLKLWLQNYAYHTQLSFSFFLHGLFIIVAIAMVPILSNILRVSRVNPIKSLRYE